MRRRLCVFGLVLAMAVGVRADEIRLKDGSKIIGTIVDFENDSFKVQTAYGFAMVRKDSIAQIIPAEPGKGSESAKASAPAVPTTATVSSPAVKPETQPAVSRGTTASGLPSIPSAPMNLAMPAPNPRPA